MLGKFIQQKIVPIGYGVAPEEWENGSYPHFEDIDVGRRRKGICISLSAEIWLERAILWVQALFVLTQLKE
jgi:hypothetical protein